MNTDKELKQRAIHWAVTFTKWDSKEAKKEFSYDYDYMKLCYKNYIESFVYHTMHQKMDDVNTNDILDISIKLLMGVNCE